MCLYSVPPASDLVSPRLDYGGSLPKPSTIILLSDVFLQSDAKGVEEPGQLSQCSDRATGHNIKETRLYCPKQRKTFSSPERPERVRAPSSPQFSRYWHSFLRRQNGRNMKLNI
jgi:hypothetical protein